MLPDGVVVFGGTGFGFWLLLLIFFVVVFEMVV
jgi:hypothetical protein